MNKLKLGLLTLVISLFTISCNQHGNNKNDDVQIDTTSILIEKADPVKSFGILVNDFTVIQDVIKPNQTLSVILGKHSVKYKDIDELVRNSKEIFDVRRIKSGNHFYIFQTKDSVPQTRYFVYQINKIEYVRYEFADSILVNREKLEVRIDTVRKSGIIESSLWMSMKNSGVDPNLALELSDIYAWTIDFYGLQKGDRFIAIYEKKFIDTNYIGLGKIIACRFDNNGQSFFGYRFKQDSIEDIFDNEGGSLRRAFLKAPLKFRRISSRFSNSRYHPVLKIRRPHHGVDYAAATGTPVHTIGDGRITFVGRKGGYGKRVEIKHNGIYSTGYAHLSRYANGLKKGDFVKQGTTIGYVGSTGMSTGPHLDFRVYKNGQPIDPLKMKSPPALPIKKEYLDEYNKVMSKYSRQLEF
ncbi:MAG: metalloendopeptidase [Bacteroidetes bacterium]|nr:MAG: metalloendopeptidase [Bacteroidota bacterium]